jgi:hypothetical protein
MPDQPIRPPDADDLAENDRDEEERARGYEEGWDDASLFIERHPHGMPWALTRQPPEPEPEDPYEKGRWRGWHDRLKKEGWE